MKVLVTTTPTEGNGSIMRARTFIDARTASSLWRRAIAWLLAGISASQLAADIDIMCNKIRLKRPILQPFDGPYQRMNTWLKQFYSEGSDKLAASCHEVVAYANDW